MPWSDGRRYVATVVWVGADSARVEFEDGSLKTVPHEKLELLNKSNRGVAASRPADRQASDDEDADGDSAAMPVPSEKDAQPPLPTEPCAICMTAITEDVCVLDCGHAFHAACLGEMADVVRVSAPTRRSLGVTCPLCRKVTRAGVGAAEEA